MAKETVVTPLNELDKFLGGAISERMGLAMSDVAANILDQNTKAAEKRKIVMEITIRPSKSRKNAEISMVIKTTLASLEPIETSVAVGADDDGCLVLAEVTEQPAGQMDLFGGEVKPNVTKFPPKDKEASR